MVGRALVVLCVQWIQGRSRYLGGPEFGYRRFQDQVGSAEIRTGALLRLPYSDRNKFDAPFVGVWNLASQHTTKLTRVSCNAAVIEHTLDQNSYYTIIQWEGKANITGPTDGTHRYRFTADTSRLQLTLSFALTDPTPTPAPRQQSPVPQRLGGATTGALAPSSTSRPLEPKTPPNSSAASSSPVPARRELGIV